MKSKATILLLICMNFAASGAELPPEMASKILQRFPQADRDGDGKLSKSEGDAVQKKIIKKFPQADADGDGELSKAELMNLAKTLKKNKSEAPKNVILPEATNTDSVFNIAEILDESTLETKTLQDWHPVGATRQKLIEINVAEWWPGQDYRIPVRLIVPLKGKAKGFHITGGATAQSLSKDTRTNAIDAKLLANGVGVVKTVVKNIDTIPGKKGLQTEMQKRFMRNLNMRYSHLWIWSMTLMRATTAAYAEVDYFEKGKVAGSGGSKNGISPAIALINDERFTATCSNVAFAWASPTRKGEPSALQKAKAANENFFKAANAGEFELEAQRAKYYRSHMKGADPAIEMMAQQTGVSIAEIYKSTGQFVTRACVTENWNRLMERGADVLFQPGTHDWVAYDILWGAQNHPQLPVYYAANGGHGMQTHSSAEKDNENLQAFLWHHFFGGEPLLSPPTSSHEVVGDKLNIQVNFENGPKAESGRIWWMYDRAPAGSAPFLHERIPEDQWADMEQDPKTGAWTATIRLQKDAARIDFFSNHGKMVNGYQHYLSSPYTRIEFRQSGQRDKTLKRSQIH